MIAGKSYTEEELSEHVQLLNRGLNLIEKRLDQNRYLCGNWVSIADLSAACELEQTRFISLDLAPYRKTKAWLHHMIDENPTLLELHSTIRELAARAVEKQQLEAATSESKF